MLRTAYADLYRQQTRWADLLKFTTAWIARKPEYGSAYAQHLSALVMNDRFEAANALVEQWLKEARIEGKLAPDQFARLGVAVCFAQGNTYDLQLYRTQQRWNEPLADTARFFARSKDHLEVAQRIMASPFTESDSCDRLRASFLGLLQTDLEQLTPAQIDFLIGQSLSGRFEFAEPVDGRKQMDAAEIPDAIWKKIAAELHARWAATKDTPDENGKYDKHFLGEALRTINASRFADTDLLPFLRERIKDATPALRQWYVSALFDALLRTSGATRSRRGVFAVAAIVRRSAYAGPAVRADRRAHRLDDAMLANRQAQADREAPRQRKCRQTDSHGTSQEIRRCSSRCFDWLGKAFGR